MSSSRFSVFSLVVALATAPLALASIGVHCGTTADATLSDCQALVQPAAWNAAWAGTSNVCHFGLGAKAFNTACQGNCCVYWASLSGNGTPDEETTRQNAAGLLGCGDSAKNKINGLQVFSAGYGVCLSNGSGCGDCFDDSDFSN